MPDYALGNDKTQSSKQAEMTYFPNTTYFPENMETMVGCLLSGVLLPRRSDVLVEAGENKQKTKLCSNFTLLNRGDVIRSFQSSSSMFTLTSMLVAYHGL